MPGRAVSPSHPHLCQNTPLLVLKEMKRRPPPLNPARCHIQAKALGERGCKVKNKKPMKPKSGQCEMPLLTLLPREHSKPEAEKKYRWLSLLKKIHGRRCLKNQDHQQGWRSLLRRHIHRRSGLRDLPRHLRRLRYVLRHFLHFR